MRPKDNNLPPQPPKTCAIAIPIYRWPLSAMQALSVHRTTQVLASYDIVLVGPPWLADVAPAKINSAEINVATFDAAYFRSTKTYNKLLLSLDFFKTFDAYDYLLIAQTDTLTFRDELAQWCAAGYDYIGAPWIDWNAYPKVKLTGVGNGGYSLRSVPRAIQTLTEFRYAPFTEWQRSKSRFWNLFNKIEYEYVLARISGPFRTRINEDLFWGKVAPRINRDFTLASTEDAIRFSFEAAPETLYELNNRRLPFGCHAFESYNLPFWIEHLGERYFKVPAHISELLMRP
jgi:hypothetical protein